MNREHVAIITLTKRYNYGNMLQNYAVQVVLSNLGVIPETIIYEPRDIKQRIKYYIKRFFKRDFQTRKQEKFDVFEKKFIKKSHFKNLYKNLFRAECRYSYYVVGSDQVWNPTWYGDDFYSKYAYLLTFTEEKKKIAYAASFGINTLPTEWEEWFKIYLSSFKSISVRENTGTDIVFGLTNRNATVVVDPTLMIDTCVWESLENRPKYIDTENYVLCYFLSEPNCSVNEIKKSLEDNYRIVNIMDGSFKEAIGPSEFLWLVNHASLVLTDSFHACVFSFLFNKAFIVFDRNWDSVNMNSRIDTLLSTFHLERKYINSGIENDLWEHDYKKGYAVLEMERNKAYIFLKAALGKE